MKNILALGALVLVQTLATSRSEAKTDSRRQQCDEVFFSNPHLASLPLDTLMEQLRCHYEIREFRSPAGGRLVLVGEIHVSNSHESLALIEEVIKRVQIRAIEIPQDVFELVTRWAEGQEPQNNSEAKYFKALNRTYQSPSGLSPITAALRSDSFYTEAGVPSRAINVPIDMEEIGGSGFVYHRYMFSGLVLYAFGPFGIVSLLEGADLVPNKENKNVNFAALSAVIALVNWGSLRAEMFLGKLLRRHSERGWYKTFLFQYDRLMRRRDKWMAKQIASLMDEYKDHTEPVLALVGAAHVPGLSELLTEQYKFQSVELPAPECSER